MNPKVSIIVPVYKTRRTLYQCVDSLLHQTITEIEIILVDDGSPDGAGEICDKLRSFDRIKVIHKENGGLSSARNAGLEIATGDYIGFVDSDDYVHQDMYLKLYNRIERDCADICICSHYTVDCLNNVEEHYFYDIPEILDKEKILRYLILPLIGNKRNKLKEEKNRIEGFVCRNLYRRELIISYKFWSERKYFAEDVISALDLYTQCSKISILNECLYYYQYNEESLSNRYRPSVYILLNNLLKWEADYLIKQHLENTEEDRLYTTGLKFTIFSIKNIKKGNLKKKQEIDEVKKIYQQDMLKKSMDNITVSIWEWKISVVLLLFRFRCIRLLLKLI